MCESSAFQKIVNAELAKDDVPEHPLFAMIRVKEAFRLAAKVVMQNDELTNCDALTPAKMLH